MAVQPVAQSTIVGHIGEIRKALFTQRGTILISLVAACVLALPTATLEIYRVLADDVLANDDYDLISPLTNRNLDEILPHLVTWVPICLAFLTLFLASAIIWYVGRDLAGQVKADDPNAHGLERFLHRWLPVVFALLLPLGAAFGMYQASHDAIGNRRLALRHRSTPPSQLSLALVHDCNSDRAEKAGREHGVGGSAPPGRRLYLRRLGGCSLGMDGLDQLAPARRTIRRSGAHVVACAGGCHLCLLHVLRHHAHSHRCAALGRHGRTL